MLSLPLAAVLIASRGSFELEAKFLKIFVSAFFCLLLIYCTLCRPAAQANTGERVQGKTEEVHKLANLPGLTVLALLGRTLTEKVFLACRRRSCCWGSLIPRPHPCRAL